MSRYRACSKILTELRLEEAYELRLHRLGALWARLIIAIKRSGLWSATSRYGLRKSTLTHRRARNMG